MTSMTHDELRELTGGYALGVLSDEERRALEAHLSTCRECTLEVRELARVAAGLAHAVPQVDPPAALRGRVLNAVRDEPARPAHSPKPAQAVRAAAPIATWLAVAASIAALALGLYTLTLRERIETLQAQLRDVNARFERELQIARASADRANHVSVILAAADVRRIDLAGQAAAPQAAGRAYWSPSRGLIFTATNLPALAPGKQYQLWVIPPGKNPVSAGMIDLETDGRAIVLVDPSTAAQVGTVAVSVEPAGGVQQPTGDIVLAGTP
jgi:anti-sigma-K factor RskA